MTRTLNKCLVFGEAQEFARRVEVVLFNRFLNISTNFVSDLPSALCLLHDAPEPGVDSLVVHIEHNPVPGLTLAQAVHERNPHFPVMVCASNLMNAWQTLHRGIKVWVQLPCSDEYLADAFEHMIRGDVLIASGLACDDVDELLDDWSWLDLLPHEQDHATPKRNGQLQPPQSTAQRTILLTAREKQVAHMLKVGLSVKEIGSELGISPLTVATHVKNAYKKLGVSSRSHLRKIL